MDIQSQRAEKTSEPDIKTILLDFARLSLRVRSSETYERARISRELLTCLMEFCAAQRGALLLTPHDLVSLPLSASDVDVQREDFRAFALMGMSEGEAFDALMIHAAQAKDSRQVQTPWHVSVLPVSLPYEISQGIEGTGYTVRDSVLAHWPLSAVLILECGSEDTEHGLPTLEDGRAMLPLIAEGVGAVIHNVLLAERVHELEARDARKGSKEMEPLKPELLATFGHELRSPLASIKGYAATLLRHERRISREERHEFLLAINAASDRLSTLVDKLLEVSQLEIGTISVERAEVNLAHLVREAIISAEERLREERKVSEGLGSKGRHFTFQLLLSDQSGKPTTQEPVILADRHRLREVLDNLLENAINYSPEGGTIVIALRPVAKCASPNASSERGGAKAESEVRSMIQLSISDSGVGIPAEQLNSIFQRFHRVDAGLTREVNGLGLGLAICKYIVELHTGTIWAESEIGKGSTFHVCLPVAESGQVTVSD